MKIGVDFFYSLGYNYYTVKEQREGESKST